MEKNLFMDGLWIMKYIQNQTKFYPLTYVNMFTEIMTSIQITSISNANGQ